MRHRGAQIGQARRFEYEFYIRRNVQVDRIGRERFAFHQRHLAMEQIVLDVAVQNEPLLHLLVGELLLLTKIINYSADGSSTGEI